MRFFVLTVAVFAAPLALMGCTSDALCNSNSCRSGCCDSNGMCQSGQSNNACGVAGNACMRCNLGATCNLGVCATSSGGGGGGGTTGGGSAMGGGNATGGGGGTGGGSAMGGGAGTGGGSATGGGGATGGGMGGNTCVTNADCSSGFGCHPVTRICTATCTSPNDCPASSRTCSSVNGSPSMFCLCTTDALCASQVPMTVCHPATRQCGDKCTTGADCPQGATCNTGPGVCSFVSCNNTSQPDICGYGNICSATNNCAAIFDNRTCTNISSSNRPAWNTTSTGAVIYRVDDEAVDDAAACASGTPFTTTVYAYAPMGMPFPAMKSNLPGFFYYSAAGTAADIPTNLLTQANYTLFANDTVMSARFTVCSATSPSMLTVGFGFTNGNSVCAVLTHSP